MPASTGHISEVMDFEIQELKVDFTITATRCTQPYRSSGSISPYSSDPTRHNGRQSVRYKQVGRRAAAVSATGSGTLTLRLT